MSRRCLGLGLLAALVLAGGCNNNDNPGFVEPPIPAPNAASDLYAAATSPARITLRWKDNSDTETGFRIERRVGETGEFLPVTPVDTVAASVTSFEDATVTNETRYTYRVTAYRFTAEALASNEVTVLATNKQAPSAPSSPTPADGAQGVDENSVVTLTWVGHDPAGEALTYDVLFGRSFGAMTKKAEGISESTFVLSDETYVRNAHYFWRVIAHDRTGVSAPSPVWGFNTPVDRDTVPAGFVCMGDTLRFLDGDSSQVNPLWHPGSPVETQAFVIDRYLVTNQQYADFLNQMLAAEKLWIDENIVYNQVRDNLWAVLSPRDTDCDITFSVADSAFVVTSGRESFPVVQVSWYGANAYAQSYGRRLPTESEWEKAARGTARDVLGYTVVAVTGDTVGLGYPYPWGVWVDAGDLNRGNFRNSGDPYENAGRVRSTPPGFYDGTVRLGYQTANGASPFGVYDMSGNVWQWTADWYAEYRSPHIAPRTGNFKIVRGGSFDKPYGSANTWNRSYVLPTTTDRTIGFRTAGAR